RHRLHAVRPERGVLAHPGRTGQREQDPARARLPDRHPGRQPRSGRGDRHDAGPAAAARDVPAPAEHQAPGVVMAPRTQREKTIRRHVWIYAGLTPFLFIAVFPIYWMAITAFKQDPDLYRMDHIPFWFNMAPTLKHFQTLFYQTNYGAWIINTM